MGFLDKLKAMFGISAAKVDILLATPAFALGQPVQGQVVLETGAVEQHVSALTIDVIKRVTLAVKPGEGPVPEDLAAAEKAPESEAPLDEGELSPMDDEEAEQEETTAASAALAEDMTLRKGETKTFDFTLDLGAEAEPTSEAVRWVLLARAHIPAAVDATKWQLIEVTPDRVVSDP